MSHQKNRSKAPSVLGKTALPRRTLLRGLVGGAAVALALPPLEAMMNGNGVAYADDTPLPKRFGVFFWGNGVKVDRWLPSGTGEGYGLSPSLAPFAEVRDYVSVVSGMRILTGNERGHHAGTVGILSGAPMIPQDPGGAPYASTFSAPSIDQVVAERLTAIEPTRYRSLEVGVTAQVVRGEGTTLHYLSHNGPDNANPPSYSPREVFDRIFADGFADPSGEPDPRLRLRRSILDAVMGDARQLQSRVGASDRVRIEQHLDSVRALERQVQILEEAPLPLAACEVPGQPPTFENTQYREISRTMADLLAMALACDQTRVFSNMFSGSVSLAVYRSLSQTTNHHSLTHDEPGDQPQVQAITEYTMEELAYLLSALRAVPEGDGNLLDNCAILASSDVSDGRAHTITEYPILVCGGGGGALRTPGVHVRREGDNTSKVLLTLLRAMDLPFDEFGVGGGRVNEVVSELLA